MEQDTGRPRVSDPDHEARAAVPGGRLRAEDVPAPAQHRFGSWLSTAPVCRMPSGLANPLHRTPAQLLSVFLLPGFWCEHFAMDISKAGCRKTLKLAKGFQKNQGSSYNR